MAADVVFGGVGDVEEVVSAGEVEDALLRLAVRGDRSLAFKLL